ncbi:MAG: response regulator [Ahniella sp.]|nr:response regulator [Ahniella sp.]
MISPLQVLLVEDDFAIRRLLVDRLAANHVQVSEAGSLGDARLRLGERVVDLILLDLGLPDGDGLGFIEELRQWNDVPILVLSARDQEREKIRALDVGADDFLGKPFAMGELLARIRALTRRVRSSRTEPILQAGNVQIDFAGLSVLRDGAAVHLTPIELRLLLLLASQPGRVLTYRQMLLAGWSSADPDLHHYVRIVIGHLRRKLESDPARPAHLLTETGIGYRWQS